MNNIPLTKGEIDFLLSPSAIRDRANKIFQLTKAGKGLFQYNEEYFSSTVEYVLTTIRQKYPNLDIPFHSRWGHFRAGGLDRVKLLNKRLDGLDPLEQARVKLDLVIPSVLLDAGAGATWNFLENEKSYSRSEGLGLASLHLFLAGALSSDRKSLRSDSDGLRNFSQEDLRKYFQVSVGNPLVGIEGRVQLLNNLAFALENRSRFKNHRPGNMIDYLIEKFGHDIPAIGILRAVLDGFGVIWPGRLSSQGINLGDVWQYSKLGAPNTVEALVPFHKLSQWMTYSLIEPMLEAGLNVFGVEELTGLAEYRNGGLFIDSGLISLRDPTQAAKSWPPSSELIVEWRALTIYLLDRMGEEVQRNLGKTAQEFPLAKVLEGGTWWAGRFLAKEKRENGEPPLQIQSDGTVF